VVKEPFIRWPFIIITYAVCLLIVVLYAAIIWGSFSAAWGQDYTPTLLWWKQMVTRGVESILDTTFLSAYATPIAGLTGMVIAFMVVRKKFAGKDAVDFVSNLGGAVPGTILGIGFVLAFSTPPMFVVWVLYVLLAFYLARTVFSTRREQWIVFLAGSIIGLLLAQFHTSSTLTIPVPIAPDVEVDLGLGFLNDELMLYVLGGIYVGLGLLLGLWQRRKAAAWLLIGLGAYLIMANLIVYMAMPIAALSRAIPRGFWSNAIYQFSEHVQIIFQTPPPILAILYTFAAVVVAQQIRGMFRLVLTTVLLALITVMCFMGKPLALTGTAYIIVAAFAVRSLPASVRAGVAALQQIDPSIEEASSNLGADAQLTFRKVTIPLILPALLAGLIFSFTRHMTSLSAIIFLVSPRWRIVTASILSEWEQGGVGVAAAYSTTIIVLVLIAIGVLYLIVNKLFKGREVDLSLGA
jgi:iron(III) transport system permease protein